MHDLELYNYVLPPERIAQSPSARREESRLLLLERTDGSIYHKKFYEIESLLRPQDSLVLNDTQVIPARLEAERSTGGFVEILLIERAPGSSSHWLALARPSARLKVKEALTLNGRGEILLEERQESGVWTVSYQGEEIGLENLGRMPLPHYIRREKFQDPRDGMDRERYQTVYAENPGAVAAPTAGLHFTCDLLDRLQARGIEIVRLTLHVGIGTFAPVRERDFTRHRMHAEAFVLSPESAERLNRTKKEGGRVIAVGTTSARVLETQAGEDGMLRPGTGQTRLFIYPPYRFKAVDALITNFHLPRSTLLLLVSAYAGRTQVLSAYEKAVAEGYRFFSYGDAMFLGDRLLG